MSDPTSHVLSVLEDNENEFTLAFSNASNEAKTLTVEAVRGAVKTAEAEASTTLREFAGKLGIKAEEKTQIADEDEGDEEDAT